jgi:hypothetical protein
MKKESKMRNASYAAMLFTLLACLATVCSVALANALVVTPAQLHWTEVPALPPGAQMAVIEGKLNRGGPITARLRFPADYRLPANWYTGLRRFTVLSGTYYYGVGDKLDRQRAIALPAGSVVVLPPKTRHYAWTAQETVVQVDMDGPWGIVYVNPADDPRKGRDVQAAR